MDLKGLKVREENGCCCIFLKVIPKAPRNQIVGVEGGALKVKIQAPPVDGAANEAVIDFLAGLFRKPKSSILVLKGQRSRHKVVRLKGARAKDVLEALGNMAAKEDNHG